MNNYTDVLIIGAGPMGLLLACQLAWRGVRLRVVEKNGGPSHTSKALAIQARSLELFDQMGIIEPFLAALGKWLRVHSIYYRPESAAAFATLGVRTTAFILVRPDAYIAYRSQPAEWAQLTSALAQLGLFGLPDDHGGRSQ